jgi:hypothetical protein
MMGICNLDTVIAARGKIELHQCRLDFYTEKGFTLVYDLMYCYPIAVPRIPAQRCGGGRNHGIYTITRRGTTQSQPSLNRRA